jgi:hypothetical protein
VSSATATDTRAFEGPQKQLAASLHSERNAMTVGGLGGWGKRPRPLCWEGYKVPTEKIYGVQVHLLR